MTGKQILKIFLVLALMLAAISTYFAQGDKRQAPAASSNAAPRTELMREQMIEDQLKTLLAPVGVKVLETGPAIETANHQQLDVRWKSNIKVAMRDTTDTQQQGQPAQTLTVMNRSDGRGSLPRQRSLELTEEQVLIVAVGADEGMRWWTLIADPRLRREETPGPNGELSGQIFIPDEVDFAVSYPADASITELRFYHPHWTGTKFTLESIGSTPVR